MPPTVNGFRRWHANGHTDRMVTPRPLSSSDKFATATAAHLQFKVSRMLKGYSSDWPSPLLRSPPIGFNDAPAIRRGCPIAASRMQATTGPEQQS
jgi:hypothetical protein